MKLVASQNKPSQLITKPDVDNYVKGVKNALKSVIWKDDSQVVDLHVSEITIQEIK